MLIVYMLTAAKRFGVKSPILNSPRFEGQADYGLMYPVGVESGFASLRIIFE